MVDICGIFNFKKELEGNCTNPFAKGYSFNHPVYSLKETKISCGKVFCVEMEGSACAYSDNVNRIFILGTAFAIKSYSDQQLHGNKMLSPSDINGLYAKFGIEMLSCIKGNFVVIVYDDHKKQLFIASSRLNTLPIFYCYKDNNFIFSSSVKAILECGSIEPELNEKALVEQLIFYHPLQGKTCLKEIFQLPPASIIKFNQEELKIKKYWQIENLFRESRLIPERDALYKCVDLMKENLKAYTSDTKKFLLSLTAGFDSRTNLALTERDPKDFLCYSYGMPGSKQIEIPLLISTKSGLNYKAIYLDEAFERNYEKYALMALDSSNGSAPILRANFPYAFEQLNAFSKVNITGLFGSEIIKCFHRANEQVSQETMDLFMGKGSEKSHERTIKNIKSKGYINNNIIDKYSREIIEEFNTNYIKRLEGLDNIARFYVFLLEESVRKYFMQEVMIERYYVDNRIPYIDEDFLELIFKTPFAGLYKGKVGSDIFSRRNSQLFYAEIIQMTNPALGGIVTDRGYKPKNLLPSAFRVFKVLPLYLMNKIRNNIKGKDTFKSELWSKNMVEKYIYKIGKQNDIFSDKLVKNFEDGFHLKGNLRFFSTFSLRLWFSDLR